MRTQNIDEPVRASLMYFFYKMAILICITIMYAFLFSLGLFMALMWNVGPEGNWGDLRYLLERMQGRSENRYNINIVDAASTDKPHTPNDRKVSPDDCQD